MSGALKARCLSGWCREVSARAVQSALQQAGKPQPQVTESPSSRGTRGLRDPSPLGSGLQKCDRSLQYLGAQHPLPQGRFLGTAPLVARRARRRRAEHKHRAIARQAGVCQGCTAPPRIQGSSASPAARSAPQDSRSQRLVGIKHRAWIPPACPSCRLPSPGQCLNAAGDLRVNWRCLARGWESEARDV